MAAQDKTRTANPIARPPSEGEALWFNNDLLTFKATGGETVGGLVVLEEFSRHGKVTPLHTHPEETEISPSSREKLSCSTSTAMKYPSVPADSYRSRLPFRARSSSHRRRRGRSS